VIAIIGSGNTDTFMQTAQAQAYVSQITDHASDNIHRIQLGVDAGERRLAEVIGLALAVGLHVQEVSVAKPSLADVFLKYTGRELRDP
jgi:hypothetical protein